MIGNVIRGSGTRIDVHVVSHPDAAEEAFTLPRTRRPATLPRRRVAIGLALAAVGPPGARLPALAPARADRPAERAAPVPAPRDRSLGCRRPRCRRSWLRSAASCSSTGTSRRRSTRSRSAKARTSSRSSCSSPSPAIVSVFVDLAARRAAQGNRARAEAEALARLAGSASVDAVLDSLRRVLGDRRRRRPAPHRERLASRGSER